MKTSIFYLLFTFLILACGCSSEDAPDTTIPPNKNTSPIILSQFFSVVENPTQGTSIGIVKVSDNESDKLTFSKADFENSISINSSSGELVVLKDNTLFDFETAQELSFKVNVSDGEFSSSATITVTIEDEEDGPLTNYQKEIISEFKYTLLNYESGNPDLYSESIFKQEKTIHLFLDGNVTSDFRHSVEKTLKIFNPLFSDGMQIDIVDTFEESNVHVYLSPVDEIKDLWPDLYDFVINGNYGGVASGYQLESGEFQNLIWVGSPGLDIFSHELGHIMGLGHSSPGLCGAERRSMMCSSALAIEPLPIDLDILSFLYHPDISAGMPASEIDEKLTDLILGAVSSKIRLPTEQGAKKVFRRKLMTH